MKTILKQRWPVLICFVLLATVLTPARQAIWKLYLSNELYQSIAAGDASEVGNLLRRGADPNRIGAGGLIGGTPLTWATEQSDLKIIKVLIKGGADVNKRIGRGYTALMLAATPQVAQLLLDAGSNSQLKNIDGQTALQIAQERKLAQVIKILQRAEPKHKKL